MPNTSSAYDFEYFAPKTKQEAAVQQEKEERRAEERQQRIIELTEKQLRRSHRHNAYSMRILFSLFITLAVITIVGVVVLGQVQLTELTEQIHAAEETLAEEKSLSVQLEMQAVSDMNTEQLAQYARERLGMEEVAQGQTTYISLVQGDAGTVLQEESGTGFFSGLWEVIRSVFPHS